MTTAPATSAPRLGIGRARVVGALQQQGAIITAVLVALLVFGALRYGSAFATGFNFQSVLADDAKYALVALGMTFVIMTGGIDLSVGAVALLGGVVAAQQSGSGILVGTLVGALTLRLLENTLIAHGVSRDIALIIQGAVIVAALYVQRSER